jgi:hypothetical protein
MVEIENIEIEPADAQMLIAAARIARGRNGEWTLILSIDGDLQIDADRVLPLRGELRLKGRQRGRKGNPAQNWGSGGFKKKAV